MRSGCNKVQTINLKYGAVNNSEKQTSLNFFIKLNYFAFGRVLKTNNIPQITMEARNILIN